jgi:hypothetical protein
VPFGMAQKGYLGNGPYEVWHCGPDFRMFLFTAVAARPDGRRSGRPWAEDRN